MNVDASLEPSLTRLLGVRPFIGFAARVLCTTFLLSAGIAGLAFLFDAQAVGPGRLQVNEMVRGYILGVAQSFLRTAVISALLVETTLPILSRIGWRRVLFLLPLVFAGLGAYVVYDVFILKDLEIVQKSVMIRVGGGVVFFLAVSMHATLWQASFDVAPEVTDFPYPWYLVLVMLMAGFFGAFRGWTDVNPVVKRVLDYRERAWSGDRPINPGQPTEEEWTR